MPKLKKKETLIIVRNYRFESKILITWNQIKHLEIGEHVIITLYISRSGFMKHLKDLSKLNNCYYKPFCLSEDNLYKVTKYRRRSIIKENVLKKSYRLSSPSLQSHGYKFDIKELKRIRNGNTTMVL